MGNPERRSQFALRRSQRLLGISIPENGGIRRSRRLRDSAKSAMTVSQQRRKPRQSRKSPQCRHIALTAQQRDTLKSLRKLEKIRKCVERNSIWATTYYYHRLPDIDKLLRSSRKSEANRLKYGYFYCSTSDHNNGMEKRTLLFSNIEETWEEKSHGTIWVAVHGVNSICVAFRNEELDEKRIRHTLSKGLILTYFGKYVICMMEDLADSSHFSEQIRGKRFAVVSRIPSTSNVLEESCHEASVAVPGEKRAIEFLQGRMHRDSAFTNDATVQTAISALQHLFHKDFKDEEIRVSLLEGNTISDLPISRISEHLAIIQRDTSYLAATDG